METSFWKQFTSILYVKRLILWVLVFLQFYPVTPIAIHLSLRVLISLGGIALYLTRLFYNLSFSNPVKLDLRYIKMFFPLLLLSAMSIFSLIYNGTNDMQFVYYESTVFLMTSSAYFTIYLFRYFYKDKLSFQLIAYYCSIVVFAQLVFGMGTYFAPNLTYPILLQTQEGLDQMASIETGRFKGLGAVFMNLGVANGVGLMFIACLLKNSDLYGIKRKLRWVLMVIFICIMVLGNMQARTTTITTLIAFGYLTFSSIIFQFRNFKNGILRLILAIAVMLCIIGFVVYFFEDFLAQNQATLSYGFEIFDSVAAGHGAQSKSSNLLMWMLTIWPNTDLGWIIGYGHYAGFYYRTDVGFARIVFYCGLIGCFFYYLFEVVMAITSLKGLMPQWKGFIFYMLVMLLIVNVKSFTEYTHYLALFLAYKLICNPDPIENSFTLNNKAIVKPSRPNSSLVSFN